MTRFGVLSTLMLLGCSKDGAADSASKPAPPAKAPATPPAKPAAPKEKAVTATPLEWSMNKSADGSSLAVSVTVTNTGGAPIWVADRLIVPAPANKFTRTDRLTVMTTDDPKTVRFVAGAVSSDRPGATLYGATFTQLAAGESAKRTYTVPLPLKAWNPIGGANALSAQATQAKLLVHTSSTDPTGWSTLATSDAEPLKVPQWGRAQTILEGKPLPLP